MGSVDWAFVIEGMVHIDMITAKSDFNSLVRIINNGFVLTG